MVKVRAIVVRCDVCGAEDAQEWFFTPPGGQRTPIDLCDEHAAPVIAVVAHAQKSGNGGTVVKTMEQIEKEKAAAKAAATRAARKKP